MKRGTSWMGSKKKRIIALVLLPTLFVGTIYCMVALGVRFSTPYELYVESTIDKIDPEIGKVSDVFFLPSMKMEYSDRKRGADIYGYAEFSVRLTGEKGTRKRHIVLNKNQNGIWKAP